MTELVGDEDEKSFVEYLPGGSRSKLIISVPHGGDMRPSCIVNRDRNDLCTELGGPYKVTCVGDAHTKQLSLILCKELSLLMPEDCRPHLVLANIHRTKVDMNREVNEATLKDPLAVRIYEKYHECIRLAKNSVQRGLFVDIHGHSHPENWVELGYLLKKGCMNTDTMKADRSSVKNVARKSACDFDALIRGDLSLGRYLTEEGIKTVPSPAYPKINGRYFCGGYNTCVHGSLKNGEIDAIQIESPAFLRRVENIEKYAQCLAVSLVRFLGEHYKD